jgi:hypothetical protein
LATLIVEFPPQSFGEEAFLDATVPEVVDNTQGFKNPGDKMKTPPKAKNVFVAQQDMLPPLPSAKIRMAGRSRIALAMPNDVMALDYTLDAILEACRRWEMQLDLNAVPEPRGRVFDEVQRDAFDKNWLRAVTTAVNWRLAAEALLEALPNSREVANPLAIAAQRIARQSASELNKGRREGLPKELARAMNIEIDSLGKDFERLRQPLERKIALGALSVLTAQAFATSDVSKFDIGDFEFLPFLPALLRPHPPSSLVTALELPYRITLSPIPKSNWWHAKDLVVHNARTELWHTRLTQTSDGIGADPVTKVRALWSPDYEMTDQAIISVVNKEPPLPFRTSLDALDRKMLVRLMAGFNELHTPRPARSERLSLSALGALLDVEGNWNPPPPDNVGLEQWRHLATLGRDHYVRVVYKGFLCGFGHSASLIKVTERKFETNGTTRVAVLRQRFFIIPRERVKQYPGTCQAFAGRDFPFTSVEILTRVTPSLRPPGEKACKLGDPTNSATDPIYGSSGGKIPNRACFWPMITATRNFAFEIAATDLTGERVTFSMPLLFVGIEANEKAGDDGVSGVMQEIIARYNADTQTSPTPPRRKAKLDGAIVCYAPLPTGPAAKGDTRLPTTEITFCAAAPTCKVAATKPRFYPGVEEAQCGIAAIQRLLGKPDYTVPLTYPEVYKSAGSNPGDVFLKTVEFSTLDFSDGKTKSDTLGALATPSMAIQGLSRIMGPVAAQPPTGTETIEDKLDEIIHNHFNPATFFKGARILGGVELSEILGDAFSLAGPEVPKLLSQQLSDRIEASFDWDTTISQPDKLGLFMPNPPDGATTTLTMHGVMCTPLSDPSATTFDATATLEHFRVNLFGFVTIWFDKLTFHSKTGLKPDVAVDLHPANGDEQPIAFGGALEFVNELRNIIPSNGFSDPPSLSVTPSGIAAAFSINVPSLAVGIFALEHVSLGAGFALPFDSKPVEVRFNFSERQRPFSLTVSLLGGGGFFLIGIGTEGVREIEAALEFGAALSINLGVASGSVEVKAGVYFHWLSESVELAGYVRLHGELDVLGLISASLTFNLQLAYLKENSHSVVWGEATLVVEVEVLCFSADVSVHCRREFGGSDGDPKFIELIPDQATWTEYCIAFSEE